MNIKTIVILFSGLVLMSNAHADWNRHNHQQGQHSFVAYQREFNEQQAWQQSRIEQGLTLGHLSRSEFKKLRREQQRLTDVICKYEQDHRYSAYERRKIRKLLDRADQKIWKYNHNRTFARHKHFKRQRHDAIEYAENRGLGLPFGGKLIFKW